MATILPVSDLRNYNKVLENVSDNSPVYLTVNGRGRYVIRDIKEDEEYEQAKAMLTLLMELQKGKDSGLERGYHSIDEVRELINKKSL
ncbi:MAG: prevent-host-death protein [Erysipelotrichaceae bacterium]|nr:prevent-host-death protein [Erysipelotrichaceae bacterium]